MINHKIGKYMESMYAVVLSLTVVTSTLLTGPSLTAYAADKRICEKEEHVHNDNCYEENLICDMEETEGHTHSDDCYERVLVCGKEEHTHDDSCYQSGEDEEQQNQSDADVDEEQQNQSGADTDEELLNQSDVIGDEELIDEQGQDAGNDLEYEICTSLESSRAFLDELLDTDRELNAILEREGSDSEAFQQIRGKDDAMYAHVAQCSLCQEQLSEQGAYHERFYGVQALDITEYKINTIDCYAYVLDNMYQKIEITEAAPGSEFYVDYDRGDGKNFVSSWEATGATLISNNCYEMGDGEATITANLIDHTYEVSEFQVNGIVGQEIKSTELTIKSVSTNHTFPSGYVQGDDCTSLIRARISNFPEGLQAAVVSASVKELTASITGIVNEPLDIEPIYANNLEYGLIVQGNSNSRFRIGYSKPAPTPTPTPSDEGGSSHHSSQDTTAPVATADIKSVNYKGEVLQSWDSIRQAVETMTGDKLTASGTQGDMLIVNVENSNQQVTSDVVRTLSQKRQTYLHLLLGQGDAVTFHSDVDNTAYTGISFKHRKQEIEKDNIIKNKETKDKIAEEKSADGTTKAMKIEFEKEEEIGTTVQFHIHLEDATPGQNATVYQYDTDGTMILVAQTPIATNGNICVSLDKKRRMIVVYK